MKIFRTILALAMVLSLCACGGKVQTQVSQPVVEETPPAPVTITATCTACVTGYDWGAAVDKVVLALSAPIDSVTASSFTVTETKSATDYSQEGSPVTTQTFERRVTGAYPSDPSGNPAAGPSYYAALELYASPSDGSPINYDPATGTNTWCDPYSLDILTAPGASFTSNGAQVLSLVVNSASMNMVTDVDFMSLDTFEASDGVKYEYAHYEPSGGSDTLVVWLHGGGEGGTAETTPKTDPKIVMLSNEAANLAKSSFQKKVGGANVLIPQCPSYWLDLTGENLRDNVLAGNDGTSFYTESLKELIDTYQQQTGSTKVILTGCSNGGFMTLLMALTYPDAYDGIVPICEAMKDDVITTDALRGIVNLPMFFIYAENDTVVDPDIYERPTIARLTELGATNLHVSSPDNVVDTSGKYKDADGNPYEYMGHWSWIYFDNDEAVCDFHEGETAWDFIANIVNPAPADEPADDSAEAVTEDAEAVTEDAETEETVDTAEAVTEEMPIAAAPEDEPAEPVDNGAETVTEGAEETPAA